MFGMVVDESGFLFLIQKYGLKGKCFYKFYYEIDLEDINVFQKDGVNILII